MQARVIVILGTTASGKSALARGLAAALDGEVLSIDSMKVYRGMDIGTAKPSPQQRAAVPHHLIDVADPWESFSAARFVTLADQAVEEIHQRRRPVIAAGGTTLYFKCFYEGMFEGPPAHPEFRSALRTRIEREGLDALHAELARIDPAAAERIHRNDRRRIERALEVHHLTGRPISDLQRQWDRAGPRRTDWRWTLIGLRWPKEIAARRINARVRRMIDAGLVEEARRLWNDPRGLSEQARQAVGYRELFEHFQGRYTLDDAIERIKIDTRRLAKAQRTWMKRLPGVAWIDLDEGDAVETVLPRAYELIEA
ncbi:MAG: tRNA (adenosine(37)-N6)-dimethylallyltransferase MiaA [Planctomycetota bacterium]|nr:MAG: tRNA (adenosine(37)-N6)-dimethylallyltransferase MiaA [Planctomycetota bacterium]